MMQQIPTSCRMAAIVLLALVTTAHAQPARRTGGSQVVVHSLADVETLNLITATDAAAQEVQSYMYESLVSTDPYTLETIPWIAESLPTISADKLSYEYRIRKDARFSDGHPVTGEDFIFYLKCVKNPYVANAVPLRGYFAHIDRIELVNGDKYHIRAVMSEPYYLGDQFVGGLYAFPKHIWDPSNLSDKFTFDELNRDDPKKNRAIRKMADLLQDVRKGLNEAYLVASGPYMFEEFRRNDYVSIVRSPNYWNATHTYGAAYPERIIYRTINDFDMAVEALEGRSVDFMPMMEKTTFAQESKRFKELGLKEAIYDYPAYSYIGYNEDKPIFKEKLVRQALSRALDRDAIIRDVYFGLAIPVQSPILPKRPEYDTTLPIITYNLDEARKLLARAGWSDSDGDGILDKVIDGKKTDFRFKILLNSGNKRREQIALIFVDALKKLGIDAGTTSLEWATFLQRTRDGDYEAMVGGWATSAQEGDLYQLWHSESAELGGSNFVRYRSPEVDKLIEQIRGEFDFAKRKEMYKQIQHIINEDQPYTFLVSEKQTGAYSDRFQNVTFLAPRPCYNVAWWKLKEQ